VGTLPLAQIFGLKASFEFLNKLNLNTVNKHKNNLLNYAQEKLKKFNGIIIYNQNLISVNIITFNLLGYHPHDIADCLGKNNILLRAGDFCCPRLAELIETNSALRISFDLYNDYSDIDKLINHLQKIVQNPQILVSFS